MNINLLFPSKYLKGEDLGGKEVTVTIKEMKVERMGVGAEKEDKPVLYFERATKALILNRTNALMISGLYGPETGMWGGKRITLYATTVRAFGKETDAVRVKKALPSAAAPQGPSQGPEPTLAEDPEDMLDLDEGGVVATDEGQEEGQEEESQEATEFAAMWAALTPPQQNLRLYADRVFGDDWEMAAPWLVRRWTKMVYPSNVVRSEAELSDDQRDQLAEYIKENDEALRMTWPPQKAIMLQPITAK